MHAKTVAILESRLGGQIAELIGKRFGVAVGLEARPPKLGPLITALDEALSR